MNQEEYANNVKILKEKLNFYREENRTLTEQNAALMAQMSEVGQSMEKIQEAGKVVESSYGQVIQAYESELKKQQDINQELHRRVNAFSEALDKFQQTFVGKVFMFFFGKIKKN